MKALILSLFLLITLASYSQVEVADQQIPEKKYLGFQDGKIYLINGKVITGLVSYDYLYTSTLKFKADKDVKKPEKYLIDQVQGFTIKSDSFTVIRNFKIENPYRFLHDKFMDWQQAYAKVMISGLVSMYKFHWMRENQLIDVYLLAKQKDKYKTFQPVRTLDQQKFMLEMSAYFSECQELSNDLKQGKYTWDQIVNIVNLYNACDFNPDKDK